MAADTLNLGALRLPSQIATKPQRTRSSSMAVDPRVVAIAESATGVVAVRVDVADDQEKWGFSVEEVRGLTSDCLAVAAVAVRIERERIGFAPTDVDLVDDARAVARFVEDPRQGPHPGEGVKEVEAVVEAVHAVLMVVQPGIDD